MSRNFQYFSLAVIAIVFSILLNGCSVNCETDENSLETTGQSPYTTRLSQNVIPLKYVLRIRPVLEDNPDFMQWTAPGAVSIELEVTSETDRITLHAHNLTILEADVKLKQLPADNGMEIKLKPIEFNVELQTVTIMTESALMPGQTYELSIPFVATMVGKRSGLYGFAYPEMKPLGGLKMAAVSRFQPYHAREAFPCLDEPSFRSIFEIRIARVEKYQTFSNGRIKDTVPCQVKGWVWDRYEPTPPMSANLVSILVVDDFAGVAPAVAGDVDVKIWGPEEVIESGGIGFALNLTTKAVEFFEEYFDMPFPLKKLDSILVPKSFGPAINHWGAIVYSLTGVSIVSFPGTTAEWKRFNMASLVTHEVLHQWMGNLVSAGWWSDIWLHEGFAEYFSDLALAHDSPEFQAEITFINSHSQVAFRFDQTSRSHPVKHNYTLTRRRGRKVDETEDAVDDTVYSKGAALVRMMRFFMTESVFKDGIRAFFKKFAFKSVTQDDLFDSMNSVVTGLPASMTGIMALWTLQEGYPIVRVMSQETRGIKIKQEPFQMASGVKAERHWWIPILLTTDGQPKNAPAALHWLSGQEMTLTVDTSNWYILNSDAAGYYRVLYDEQNLAKIKAQLEKDHTAFSGLTRSQLFDDYFTFAEFSYVAFEQALSLLTYLDKERDLVVWTTVLVHLKYAIHMFNGDANLMGLQKFMVPKIEAALSAPEMKLEESEKHNGAVTLLQLELLKFGCILDTPSCADYALKSLKAWKAMPDDNPIIPDLQMFIYCDGVAAGDKEEWEFVKKMHDSTPPSEEKMFIFRALTCSKDKAILETMLEESWRDGPPMALQTLEAFTDNSVPRTMVLESLKKNMKKVYAEDFVRILSELAEYYMEPMQIEELEKFVDANKDYFMPAEWDLKEQMDRIKANALWLENTGKKMDVWFDAQLAM